MFLVELIQFDLGGGKFNNFLDSVFTCLNSALSLRLGNQSFS